MLDVKGVLLLSIWIVLPSFKEFWLCTARQWRYLRFSLIYWDLFLCFVRAGQLHSLHILPRLCSKSFKVGFSSTWTKNFQMYKLNLEKAEESEIKLPTFTGSWKKQESSRKTSTSALLTMPKSLTVDHNKLEISERDGNTRPPDLPLEKSVCRSGSNS